MSNKKYTIMGKNLLIEIIQDRTEIILSTTQKYIKGRVVQVGNGYVADTSVKYNMENFHAGDIIWFNSNASANIYLENQKFSILDCDHVVMKEGE